MRWEYVVDEDGATRVRRVVEPSDLLSWAKVPDRHCVAALAATKTPAVEVVERVLAGEGFLLVLHGDAGRGKSVAAAYGISRIGGLWVNAPELARIPLPDPDGARRETVDERMTSPKTALLVIDDVGLEHSPSGYAASRITEAVVAREAARQPTILTTNLGPGDFKLRYGERLASRINGDGIGWYTLAGADIRKTGRQDKNP